MKNNGFTLIEIIISLAIVSVLALMTTALVTTSLKNYRIKYQSVILEEKASAVMRDFEQNIRAANLIESASDNEIVYYRFYNASDVSATKVRYFKEGDQFKVGVTDPEGSKPNITYPDSSEKIRLVVGDVVNHNPIFVYYDGSGNSVDGQYDIPNIMMIGITIELDKDSAPPNKVIQSTAVNLRNMKKNL